MSELRTNKIYPRDGLPAGVSGDRQALRDLPDNSTPLLDNSTRLGISGVTWTTKP
jgi:hypothetical protein